MDKINMNLYNLYTVPSETKRVYDSYNVDVCVYPQKYLNADINEIFANYSRILKYFDRPISFGLSNAFIQNIHNIRVDKLSRDMYNYISILRKKYKIYEYEDVCTKLKFRERFILSKSIYLLFLLSRFKLSVSSLKLKCIEQIIEFLVVNGCMNASSISNWLSTSDKTYIEFQLFSNLYYDRLCKQHRPREALNRLKEDSHTVLCRYVCAKLEYMWRIDWRTRHMCIDTMISQLPTVSGM